jgi:hypothetical protein
MPILFFAGIHAMSPKCTEQAFRLVEGHGVLFSLHPEYLSATKDWLWRHHELGHDLRNTEVMFDSGAFTAWNAGEPPLKASKLARLYERAARRCDGKFKNVWFISLDVMPGAPNRNPTPQEVADAVKKSDINYAELIRALPGRILPVFHKGESPARLNEVQDMSDYVCLSPLTRTPEHVRIKWSMRVAAHLKARNPGTQLHGLAATGERIMQAVNWRSVDSTAWIYNAGLGILFVEHDDRILRIPIGRHGGSRRHFDHQEERLRARIVQLAVERGVGLGDLRDHPYARQLWNLQTMAEWSRRVTRPKETARRK